MSFMGEPSDKDFAMVSGWIDWVFGRQTQPPGISRRIPTPTRQQNLTLLT